MESLGPFTIHDRLGAGMLGELFRARDTRAGRTVALRVVDPRIAGDPAARQSLLADARRLLPLVHPSVAVLLDIVEDGDRLFLVHELAAGQPLAELTGGQMLAPALAVKVAAQVADAVAAAAALHIVNGALDPADIIVGGEGRVKILDYGLARWTRRGAERRAAQGQGEPEAVQDEATLARAAGRLSPEQSLGEVGDARSDIFTLGVILYEMLAGRPPFSAEAGKARAGNGPEKRQDLVAATQIDVLRSTPAVPSHFNSSVPPALDSIVMRALAKSLDARYQGGEAMAGELKSLTFAPPALPTMPVPRPHTGRRARAARRRRILIASVITALVVLAVAAWFGRAWLTGDPQGEPVVSPTVMVLPFSVAGDTPRDYVGPGVAEDLASWMSEVPGVSVVGRTWIRALDARAEWRVRARKLGATMAIGGTIRPGAESVEADVEVLDAQSGAPVWSQHFQQDSRRLTGLEAEIAAKVAEYLGLQAPNGNRWTQAPERQIDPMAYDLYLEGREAAARRDRSRAIALFDQALEREPRLVEARASLSQALYLEEYYAGGLREASAAGRALREADAALAVDPELVSAHVAAALAAPTAITAASSLSRALVFDPSNGEAWHYAGDLVGELDPARSVAFYRTSLAYEPALDANWRDIASAQAMAGDYEQAERALVSGEALRPDRVWWKQMRARLDLERGRGEQALPALQADASVESAPIVWLMGRVVPLVMLGRAADAEREGRRLVERYPAFCEGRAVLAGVQIDAGLGDSGRAAAADILDQASRTGAEPALAGCAALAAAGTGDAAEAAGWLSRVARDERALRAWTRQAIFGVGLSFRQRWYPWTKVLGKEPVQVAAGQLQQSLARVRDETERRLPTPPAASAR